MTSGRYFNKGMMALDTPHIGYVTRETEDKIIVFDGRNYRYDIPKSEILTTGRNVLIGLPLNEIIKKYKINRKEPLPKSTTEVSWTSQKVMELAT